MTNSIEHHVAFLLKLGKDADTDDRDDAETDEEKEKMSTLKPSATITSPTVSYDSMDVS